MFTIFENFLILFSPKAASVFAKISDTFAVVLRLANEVYGFGWNLPG